MPVLMALFLVLWPSVLSATFETLAEFCEPQELESDLEHEPPKPDDKPEVCVKHRCDESFDFYATRGPLPWPECLENGCIWFYEPPADISFPHATINRLRTHLEEQYMKGWLEACTPYWENRLPGDLDLPMVPVQP